LGLRNHRHRLRTLKTTAEVEKAYTAMETMFYADGNFFRRIFEFLQSKGRTAQAAMIRRALFVHQ
jgi:hypothetical protein